jgi:hypothetical protein
MENVQLAASSLIKNKILIVVAEHNEYDMQKTIDSAIDNAFNQDLIAFSICSTNRDIENKLTSRVDMQNVNIYFHSALGVGFNKIVPHIVNDDSHEFTLSIDAHSIFNKNWDVTLLKNYYEINKNYENFVIAPGVPVFVDTGKEILFSGEDFSRDNLELYLTLEPTVMGHKRLTSHAKVIDWDSLKEGYKETFSPSGNCMFAKKEVFKEFIIDPQLVWSGDQEALALRMCTRGYKIFAIRDRFLYTKQKNYDYALTHPNDWRNQTNNIIWHNMFKNSDRRLKDLFTGKILGYWGAPDKNSLEEFAAKVGINFEEMYYPEF